MIDAVREDVVDHRATAVALGNFIACVFEPTDIVEVRMVLIRDDRQSSVKSTWHMAADLAAQAASLIRRNQNGWNIYVGANPRRALGGSKAADVLLARCLFADFDNDATTAQSRNRWQSGGLPDPTLAIESGHGVHPYWRLAEPLADLSRWSELQRALIGTLGTDRKIHDPPRIMRLPGFLNTKREPYVPCRIVDAHPQWRYPSQLFADVLAETGPAKNGHVGDAVFDRVTESHSDGVTEEVSVTAQLRHSVTLSNKVLDQLIARSLPSGNRQRHDELFRLARELKATELADRSAKELQSIISMWHRQALPFIGTQPFEQTMILFEDAWARVKWAAGDGPIVELLEKAKVAEPTEVARQYEQPALRLLVQWCRELQRHHVDEPFFLACRLASVSLGIDHATAALWLRKLCRDGVLREVEKGTRTTRRASRYRYLGD